MMLNAFAFGVGHHETAWRHPSAPKGAPEVSVGHFIELAKIAERGKLHGFFMQDQLFVDEAVAVNAVPNLDPLITLASIAEHTSKIGLIGTASTAFMPPYHLARLINTLDVASNGRFAWNIVTSTLDEEARNFGLDSLQGHDRRYETAADYTDAVLGLLESWQPDALVRDKGTGQYADLSKIDFEPKTYGNYRIGGPLDFPQSPQGRPALYQAGRSPAGTAFAGRYADVVFTVQSDKDEAAAQRKQVRAAAESAGRPADSIKLVSGVWPFIGSTETEAHRLYEELEELVLPAQAAGFFSNFTGLDLSDHGYDEPLPKLPVDSFQGQIGRFQKITALVDAGHNTMRKLQNVFGASRGHRRLIGTPEQIAAAMVDWFRSEAVDGYAVAAPILPHGLTLFVDQVVPELQKLGVFHQDYPEEARTFREAIAVV